MRRDPNPADCVSAERTDSAVTSIKAKRELQERVEQLKKDFDDERRDTFEITADMTRQYKAMQEELLNKINSLENTISELKDRLGKLLMYSSCKFYRSNFTAIVVVLLWHDRGR